MAGVDAAPPVAGNYYQNKTGASGDGRARFVCGYIVMGGLLELLGDGGGDGVAVNADADGLGHEVGHRDVQVAVVQLVGVPRVLYLVVFVALLVGGGANNHHAVVVGGLEVVETGLTALLGHFLLLDRAFDLEFFVLTVFVAQLDQRLSSVSVMS